VIGRCLKNGLALFVAPRSVRVRQALLAPDILDTGCRVAVDVAALGAPGEKGREASLHVVPKLASLAFGGLVADAHDQWAAEPCKGGIGK
jgi:hypothetical protein